MKQADPLRKRGFTLIELLLGMTILSLVIVSVYSMLEVATQAYRKGIVSMEVYQSARIGLRRVAEELKLALSPNAFWKPSDRYEVLPYEQVILSFQNTPMIEEEDPGAIRFLGQSNSVLYVRKVYRLTQNPPFDLQECTLSVNGERGQLILEVIRSLLKVKQASWFFQYEFQVPLNGIVLPVSNNRTRLRPHGPMEFEPPLAQYIGDYGQIHKRYVIAEHIKQIYFQYSDSDSYRTSWDSQELVREYKRPPESPNFNYLSDVIMRDKGPPQLVQIRFELENGEDLATATDIPAGNMQNLGGAFTGGFNTAGGTGPLNTSGVPTPRNESAIAVPGLPSLPFTETPFAGPGVP